MIQSLQTDNDQLKGKISTLEKDMTNLTDKTQSVMKDAETLFERICAVECINQNLLNSNNRLTDRVSLQEGNMYTIKITSKTLSLLKQASFLGILNEGSRTKHWKNI